MKTITNKRQYDLATRRVHRGIKWLKEHAPCSWRRNLFEVQGEQSIFRGKDSIDNHSVLALAFEQDSSMANEFGYVTTESVAEAFDLDRQTCLLLGFRSDVGNGTPVREEIDQAWEDVLREIDVENIPHVHEKRPKFKKGAFEKPKPRRKRP